ncbi:MAG: multicopper oxidase domain-containing protein [Anaerolineae bacterium]
MSKDNSTQRLSRRQFLRVGGGLIGAAAAATVVPKALLRPTKVVKASPAAQITEPNLHFAATDGWVHLPSPDVPPYHPDDMAPADPAGLTTYIFGFRNLTGVADEQLFSQKMKAQLVSPTFWIDEGTDFTLKLTNLGLQMRPDLIDAHTLHFHGFRNAIPIFDGEPHSSVGVPIARDLTYFYRPHDPGTYMYHCHFEETEHVHMGMVGVVFVRPAADTPSQRYAYNDPATAFDREFVMCMNEVWSLAHWCDSHVQLPEWSDYAPDFWLLNGRAYPDTLEPPGGGTDLATGELIPPEGRPDLKYQPISSLVQANSGDRVLLRFVNLGYVEQSMRLPGVPLRIVGRDATLLRGRSGNDLSYYTDTIIVGPGESVDAIFVAPDVTSETRLLLANRNYARLSNGGAPGYGGQMTEVRIFPAGTLPAQSAPNT